MTPTITYIVYEDNRILCLLDPYPDHLLAKDLQHGYHMQEELHRATDQLGLIKYK